jgi:hypothetical protein
MALKLNSYLDMTEICSVDDQNMALRHRSSATFQNLASSLVKAAAARPTCPAQTTNLIVTLPETTPVLEATHLQKGLYRAVGLDR